MYYIYIGAIIAANHTNMISQTAFEKIHAHLSYLPLLPLDWSQHLIACFLFIYNNKTGFFFTSFCHIIKMYRAICDTCHLKKKSYETHFSSFFLRSLIGPYVSFI